MRRLALVLLVALAGGLGLGVGLRLAPRAARRADPPAIVTAIREVARLETLDVRLYKKVSFSPEPIPAGSVWGDVAGWLRFTFRAPSGRAIVFADARLGLDLAQLDPSHVRVDGPRVWIVLPPLEVTVALRPGETEVIGSNLDSAETAHLLELAHQAFVREVQADAALRAQARGSAERQIRALLVTLGFREIQFVERLPAAAASS
jgi:uncharacterized protein DUF4230